jgi:glycosyltransferase involved in cell wall biosynthesis
VKVVIVVGFGTSLVNFRGELIRSIVADGHQVWGMAPEDDPKVRAGVEALGAQYEVVPFNRTSLNPLDDLKGMRALTRKLEGIRPDVVLSATLRIASWGSLAAEYAQVPKRVAMVTGMGTAFTAEGPKGQLMAFVAKRLMKRAFRRVSQVIVQNPDDQRALLDLGVIDPARLAVVNGSGVDITKFEASLLPAGPPRVLMIARLLVEKGVREYAAAASIVRKTRPDVQFDLVGPLEDHSSGIERAEVEGWKDIVWHGQQDDVRPWIQQCALYCLPSYREGTPRTVLEALAMSRPVVTSDAIGCRETIIDGVEGFLVPPKNAEALAGALLRILDDPVRHQAMASRARRRAEEKYDVNLINREMRRLMGVPNP